MDLDNLVVRLKINGRLYTCENPAVPYEHNGKTRTKRCRSKTFFDLRFTADRTDDWAFRCELCAAPVMHDIIDEVLFPPRNDWRTPGGTAMRPVKGGLWTTLHEEYRFNLDVAADAKNAKCALFFDGETPERDALLVDWTIPGLEGPGETRVFDNPPYNPTGTIELWLTKALEQAARGVFSAHIIPMSSSVAWFNDLVVPYAEWHTFRGRIAFEDPLGFVEADDGEEVYAGERTSPKQDNLLVIYDPLSDVVGHTAVRDAKTGAYLWRRT